MKVTGSSDLGRLHSMQKRAVDTKTALDRAAVEMDTGENSSRFEATAGNLTRLYALERSLDRNAVFSQTIGLTEVRVDAMQDGLEQIQTPLQQLAVSMTTATGIGDTSAAMVHATTARNAFKDTVSVLNGQVGGLSLFSGTATDRPALASADTMLADLDALAAGSATAADAITAINNYFAPGGAFHTTGYTGSTDDLAAVDVGEGRRLDYGVRADADELVATLKAQALAAVVAGGAFAGNTTAQMAVLKESGSQLLAAKEGILSLRSDVGMSQETLENAKASRVSEKDTLDLARTGILEVDPIVSTSLFKSLTTQLDAIYTVTAKLADLSYTNYMR